MKSKTNRPNFIIGFYNHANAVTVLGLIFALAACVCAAYHAKLAIIMTLFICSGLCDLFDGVIARKIKRTETQKAFGIQLDSLCDLASFGIAPCVISMCCLKPDGFRVDIICYFYYILCSVVRLAYFNAVTADKENHFTGVPITYCALFYSLLVYILSWCPLSIGEVLIPAFFAVLGTLYVLRLKIPKPGGVWYIIFPLFAILLTAAFWFGR
ncbi:MAG: CDP-alcohol phosphatidyltransferase family protein [Clostridium sp.]|jgi:CDP-diacylglycerol--serine O-phosphatidyltransferase|nr:CDP-alcohol phosphatidyltransferase family protein [Clostridium sp.]